MQDPSKALRIAYASVLVGNVIHKGRVVEVHGKTVPVDAVYPLISITNQFGDNDSSKQCFSTNENIDIDIIARSSNGGSGSDVDDISNSVMQIIGKMNHSDYPIIDTDYWIVDINFESKRDITERDMTFIYDRKILSFSNQIDQI